MCTNLIRDFVVRFECVLVVFHSLAEIFVESVAEEFLVRDQRFQNQPKTFFDLFELNRIVDYCKGGIVRKHWYSEYEHIVR